MSSCLPLTKNDYYVNRRLGKKCFTLRCSLITVAVLLIATWIALPVIFLTVKNRSSYFFKTSNCSGKTLNVTTVSSVPVFNVTTSTTPTVSASFYRIEGEENVTILSAGFQFFVHEQPKTVGFHYFLPSYKIQSNNGKAVFVRNVEFGTKGNMRPQAVGEKEASSFTFLHKIFGADSAEGPMDGETQVCYEIVNNAVLGVYDPDNVQTSLKFEIAESVDGPWSRVEKARNYTLVPDVEYLRKMVKLSLGDMQ